MTRLGLLHLTDLHYGLRALGPRWPNVKHELFIDLARLHERTGPWQLVLFSGDLVQTGDKAQFTRLDTEILEELWSELEALGSRPHLLAVPGNHDLKRPKENAAVRELRHSFQSISDDFFHTPRNEHRKIVQRAFRSYVEWWKSTPHRHPSVSDGLLPGDFSASIEHENLSLGVVGLNTAFLQLTGGDYLGRLAWDIRQLNAACTGREDGDGRGWIRAHDACLLITHHGPDWLDRHSREFMYDQINPAGSFALHLFGHMHESCARGYSAGFGKVRWHWQGSSLFGMEHFGEEAERTRNHGYSAGVLELDGESLEMRIFPRRGVPPTWRFEPDVTGAILEEDWGAPIRIGASPRRGTPPKLGDELQILIVAEAGLENESAITRETIQRVAPLASDGLFPVTLADWRALQEELRLPTSDDGPVRELGTQLREKRMGCVVLLSMREPASMELALRSLRRAWAGVSRATTSGTVYVIRSAGTPAQLRGTEPDVLECTASQFQDRIWADASALISGWRRSCTAGPAQDGAAMTRGAPRRRRPYPGLESYRREDADLFFGRTSETNELRSELVRWGRGLIPIQGASGSGKSSLVRAGLLKRLAEGGIAGSDSWTIADVRLTSDSFPLESLSVVLREVSPPLAEAFHGSAQLRQSLETPEGCQTTIDLARRGENPGWRMVIFFDQFEEVFTNTPAREREALLQCITHLLDDESPVYVVLTIRDDFYTHLANSHLSRVPGSRRPYYLTPMRAAALREAVSMPARICGYEIEDELLTQILDDVGSDAGTLPLLSYTLAKLVEQAWGRPALTLADYKEIGRLHGVIQRAADGVTRKLGRDVEDLPLLFRRIVSVGLDRSPTRKTARIDDSWQKAELRLQDELVRARLLVSSTSKDEAGEYPTVELAHETVLGSWVQLSEWIEDSHKALLGLARAEEAASRWRSKVEEACAELGLASGSPHPPLQAGVSRDQAEALLEIDRQYRWRSEALHELRQHRESLEIHDLSDELQEFATPEPHWLRRYLRLPIGQQRRGEIARRLGELPDDRRGVGLRRGLPHMLWCRVPAGSVSLYLDEDSANPRTEQVSELFIGRYPVTVQQLGVFLEPGTYNDPQWWHGLPLQGERHPPYEQKPDVRNHPAAYVSWYQAMAFCRWLSDRLGLPVRLPTEWEWVQAATGGAPENLYPWGPEWNPECASHQEGLNSLVSVGMYPAGASPVGALDMSGNVYEWCLNSFRDPGALDPGDRDRVTRGGAYFRTGRDLSVRHRLCDSADGWNSRERRIVVGLRLVTDHHPPEADIFDPDDERG